MTVWADDSIRRAGLLPCPSSHRVDLWKAARAEIERHAPVGDAGDISRSALSKDDARLGGGLAVPVSSSCLASPSRWIRGFHTDGTSEPLPISYPGSTDMRNASSGERSRGLKPAARRRIIVVGHMKHCSRRWRSGQSEPASVALPSCQPPKGVLRSRLMPGSARFSRLARVRLIGLGALSAPPGGVLFDGGDDRGKTAVRTLYI